MRVKNKEIRQRRHRKEQVQKEAKRTAIAEKKAGASSAPKKPVVAPKPVAAPKPAAAKPAAEKKAAAPKAAAEKKPAAPKKKKEETA